MSDPVHALVQRLHRESFAGLVAGLAARTGDLPLAEECVQEAFARALERWRGGAPVEPLAWLSRTAQNAAIDVFRRRTTSNRQATLDALAAEARTATGPAAERPALLRDEMLRLVFTCCHPALRVENRVALCLRIVCGLETQEIARALLVSEATLAQRLVRAKRKITEAGIPYCTPDETELPERIESVRRVLYLIFNEGYLATDGHEPMRLELAEQALHLARLLASHSEDPESVSLLSLFLLQHSRRDARFDERGRLVLLPDQDRSAWHHEEIREGVALIHAVFEAGHGRGPYALQAAIAAVHATAPAAEATDWNEICLLYEALSEVDPSPVVALNHAVAISEARGPAEGLARVDALEESKRIDQHPLFHATRAALLRRCGQLEAAQAADRAALARTRNPAERRLLLERLAGEQSTGARSRPADPSDRARRAREGTPRDDSSPSRNAPASSAPGPDGPRASGPAANPTDD